MASASNRYYLDGQDLYDYYGFAVTDGRDDLLRPPAMDEPMSHKFTDMNGVDYDLSSPTFTYMPALLQGVLYGTSEANFWSRYNSLFGPNGVLRSPGSHQLTVVELDRIFEVFYREVPNVKLHQRIKEVVDNRIRVKMGIRFEVLDSWPISGLKQFYGGSGTAFPTTWSGISILPFVHESTGNSFFLNTGTVNKYFYIAIPAERVIQRIIDLSASNLNLTPAFELLNTIENPTGIDYDLYGFSQSIPYSINHVYRIELD